MRVCLGESERGGERWDRVSERGGQNGVREHVTHHCHQSLHISKEEMVHKDFE